MPHYISPPDGALCELCLEPKSPDPLNCPFGGQTYEQVFSTGGLLSLAPTFTPNLNAKVLDNYTNPAPTCETTWRSLDPADAWFCSINLTGGGPYYLDLRITGLGGESVDWRKELTFSGSTLPVIRTEFAALLAAGIVLNYFTRSPLVHLYYTWDDQVRITAI